MAKDNKAFSEQDLTKDERASFTHYKSRIQELQEARRLAHYNTNIEETWRDADRDYVPHRLSGTGGKKVFVEDETKGWRSSIVKLGSNQWQSNISKANPFTKIQTALSILVDKNPSGVFMPTAEKYQSTNELMKQLYERSWEVAKSKEQLKKFVFNLAKYGWAIGRTYPYKLTRKVKELTKYDPDDPSKSEYEEREVVEYNDIYRENLDPWNCWIDDMARPNDDFSVRDWAWRRVMSVDSAEEEFGKYPRWEEAKNSAPGNVNDVIWARKGTDIGKRFKESDLMEVLYYENRLKDLFMVVINGVPVIIEPLPISDHNGVKKLSMWQAYWNLRHAESPYGVGIYEAIRYDNATLDRVRNMTIDQLTLSIYKMFFFQGTNALSETGDIKIAPGVGKQVLDPKNVNFLQIPGPGKDAYEGMRFLQEDVDEASGVTDALVGTSDEKTAFQSAVNKEAALKRLKNPLDNIISALTTEGYITVSLISMVYSLPEIIPLTDEDLISEYLQEIDGDPTLFDRDENGTFQAKLFPEFPLNIDKDDQGNLIETKDTKFFRIKPESLKWNGVINIKPQSVLTPSKQVDKAMDLEFYNSAIPVIAQVALERQTAEQLQQPTDIDNLPHGKILKSMIMTYERDVDEVIPDAWLEEQSVGDQPLFVPSITAEQEAPQGPQAPQAPQAQPNPQAPNSQNIAQKAISAINPFKK
jgi:hypothetical protein